MVSSSHLRRMLMPQRSNLFKSHWSNQWLTFCAVTPVVRGGVCPLVHCKCAGRSDSSGAVLEPVTYDDPANAGAAARRKGDRARLSNSQRTDPEVTVPRLTAHAPFTWVETRKFCELQWIGQLRKRIGLRFVAVGVIRRFLIAAGTRT